ncbi:MAG: ribosomal protein methyltransferase, partial [Thermodesulfobacteriota bacterium]|nr:ribosomal protein methyltransferase [Thermodesulfobacteriota bacterium]
MSRSATRNNPASNNPEEPVSVKASGRVREYILEAVAASPELLTFGKLAKVIKSRLDISRNDLKKAVGKLVTEGELIYSYKHGCSFLEKSFDKPVRISKRIVLAPYRMMFQERPEDVVIRLQHGISFGSGDHPTTRLALKGIEYVFEEPAFPGNGRALDIGTGSGVLAIACVMMGSISAAGVDTDPCARNEAVENARINRIGNRIEILDTPVENIKGRFSIVT